ncbi:hypothetical protein [Roseomonas sp. HF4]|uniref:hypothetical protein n=1 Tax=Roseomonas sp. HF4 TaxID=2562313 RepID=UPI001484F40C|nr:hypothetical protein [Roseomonas sp. HF4]
MRGKRPGRPRHHHGIRWVDRHGKGARQVRHHHEEAAACKRRGGLPDPMVATAMFGQAGRQHERGARTAARRHPKIGSRQRIGLPGAEAVRPWRACLQSPNQVHGITVE